MANFNAEVEHTLGQQSAIERLKGFVDRIQQTSEEVKDMQGEWKDNVLTISFRIYGLSISANMTVEANRVVVAGQMPFAAVAFRGKIEGSIAEKLRQALA